MSLSPRSLQPKGRSSAYRVIWVSHTILSMTVLHEQDSYQSSRRNDYLIPGKWEAYMTVSRRTGITPFEIISRHYKIS